MNKPTIAQSIESPASTASRAGKINIYLPRNSSNRQPPVIMENIPELRCKTFDALSRSSLMGNKH